jgi:hypothetical protein
MDGPYGREPSLCSGLGLLSLWSLPSTLGQVSEVGQEAGNRGESPAGRVSSQGHGWIDLRNNESLAPSRAEMIILVFFFLRLVLMAGRNAIRAAVSMEIAPSDSLLALANNHLKALRSVLFWLIVVYSAGLSGMQRSAVSWWSMFQPSIPQPVAQDAVKKVESSHRWFKCSCCYENDRDVIAVVNLNGRVSLTPPLSLRDVKPNP